MNPLTTNALVLRKIPYGEGDWIVTFLTGEGSRFTAFAPSARRSQKRFGGALDLFNYLTLHYKDGQELARLQSVDLIRPMEGVRKDLTKFAVACYFAELILEFLPEKEKTPALFHSFYGFLQSLEGPEELPAHHVPLMEHQLLEIFGFKPTLSHCLTCNVPLAPENTYYFNGVKGGVVCLACSKHASLPRARLNTELSELPVSYPLSYRAIQRITEGGEMDPNRWRSLDWDPQDVTQARRAFEYFIQYTAGKPLKSLQFLSKILS